MRIISLVIGFLLTCSAAFANGPVMGWSTWNTYRVNINDTLIYSQAKAIVDLGLDSLGYKYVNIDDGFFGGRDPETGTLKFHPTRFPEGLAKLVTQIHSLGLKAGIYSDAGLNTCGNYWDNDTIACNVGLYGHELQDCKLFFDSLRFDRIKVDFCGGDPKQNAQKLSLSPQQRYTAIRHTLDSLGHQEVKLGVCRWTFPGTWVSSVASDWRISPDINCSWQSVLSIIRENMYLSGFSSFGHSNDMDMLEIGRGLSHEEERTHFGIWCIMNSPLLIGCDLNQIPDKSLDLLKNRELINLNQDTLGEQAYPLQHQGEGIVLVRDIEIANGPKRAVALFNPTDSAINISVSARELLFDSPIEVRDLFRHQDLGAKSSISLTVEPHNTYIYLVQGTKRAHRTLYEAESTFVSDFQKIEDPIEAHTPYLMFDKKCSGGVYWKNARSIRFPKLFVTLSGIYNVTVHVNLPLPSAMVVTTNHHPTELSRLSTNGFEKITLALPLKSGLNEISINSLDAPFDIDCLTVHPL